MKLSEQLKRGRIDRPDEWTMDRYIQEAEKMETKIEDLKFLLVDIHSSLRPLLQSAQGAVHLIDEARKLIDPAPEVIPGTQDALDKLTIRKDDQ